MFHIFVCFLVGHGRSEGERVQISSFSIYVADVLKHIDEVLLNNAGLPIFLFGHSMASTLFIVDYLEKCYTSKKVTVTFSVYLHGQGWVSLKAVTFTAVNGHL